MYQDYYERLTSFVIDHVLPPEVWPIVYILTGSRARGIWTENDPYRIIGIHLADTTAMLTWEQCRPRIHHAVGVFNADFEPALNLDEIHLSVESYEWWTYLDKISSSCPREAIDIAFLPTLYEAPIMKELQHFFPKFVSTKTFDWVKAEIISLQRFPAEVSIEKLFRGYQYVQLLKTGDFSWDAEMLFRAESGSEALKLLLDGQAMSQEAVAREAQALKHSIIKYESSTNIPWRIPKKLLVAADKVVMRCRSQLI